MTDKHSETDDESRSEPMISPNHGYDDWICSARKELGVSEDVGLMMCVLHDCIAANVSWSDTVLVKDLRRALLQEGFAMRKIALCLAQLENRELIVWNKRGWVTLQVTSENGTPLRV